MSQQRIKRKLATIFSADIAGYSRLMNADEEDTFTRLTAYRAIVDDLIDGHGGRVFGTAGDSVIAEFDSAVDAVRGAVAIQDRLETENTDLDEDRRMRFRIGINLGDVIVEGTNLLGDGVNVAARLETLAQPGSVCISATVHDHVKSKLDVPFTDLGPRSVKNIPDPVHAYMVGDCAPPEDEEPRAKPPRLVDARGSIAVLPFDSLSPDPNDAYLADGLTTEIITMLSRIPNLRVASRSALFAYRDRKADVWDTVRDLDLQYVLTGTIRHAGDRIRVVAELSDCADRTQLWSNTYERQLADIFAVQEEIAEAIVIAFGGEYLRAEWRRARGRPTGNLDAWGLVQKARSLNLPVNHEARDDALALAEEAVKLDPAYAGGQANLASTLMQRVINGYSSEPEKDRARAIEAIELAAELAPNDPTVLRTMGNVWSNCGEHDKAIRALRRAVELSPFDFHSWGRLGRTLVYGGDAEDLREGHAILDRILANAPNHPMVPYWLYFKANACVREDAFEEAVRLARQSTDAQPGFSGAWITLANALGQLGRIEEAQSAMQRARRANPDMTPEHLAQQIQILAGGKEGAADKSVAGLKAAGLF